MIISLILLNIEQIIKKELKRIKIFNVLRNFGAYLTIVKIGFNQI